VTEVVLREWVNNLCSEWNKVAQKTKGEKFGFKYDVQFRVGSLVTSFDDAQPETEFFVDRDVGKIVLETFGALTVEDITNNQMLVEGYFGEGRYDDGCAALGLLG
jgi:hypothetical protein